VKAVLVLLLAPVAAPAPQDHGVVAWVIDGDTFRLAGGEKIRIAGIDAPESRKQNARCATEIARGKDATRSAVALLKGQDVTIERVGRSYDRSVARVRVGGRDVAALLVAHGIARWWPRGRAKPDWCHA